MEPIAHRARAVTRSGGERRRDLDCHAHPASDHHERRGRARRPAAQRAVEVIDALDRRGPEFHEQVTVAETRTGRRAVGLDRLDLDGRGTEAVVVREATIERPADRTDAEPRAANAAVLEQLAEHPRCGLDGDRKANALRARDDRGVDADHAAGAIEPVSYTHLRAHETDSYLVCRLLLEKKKTN